MKKHNFFAGPAILPASVLEQATAATQDFKGMGLSILEISHRSKQFAEVLDEGEALVKELLGLSDDYAVLFLTGGASSQFYMAAMNILNSNETAAYVNTGAWSTKAIKEAKLFGGVEEVASSEDTNFNYIPKGYDVAAGTRYLHLTSNNTIFGTQIQEWPDTDVPFVCDMSSDIFSRPLPVEKFDLIYAGAQKNLGPAGTTLVIVKKDILGKVARKIPTMLDYRTHIKKQSAFNTPPVFPIYVCTLTLKWIKENGGLAAMQKHNEEKAALLYNEIDSNPLFRGTAAKEDRSLMNVTFLLNNEDLADDFLADCTAAGCVGVKGHRSVGGFRASIYNAMPKTSVQVLVDVMKKFAEKHASVAA
ncbi:MAG: 3-phosphoserine/phosphohydroxythreonine transaminase [Saprospiraceae bacterium]